MDWQAIIEGFYTDQNHMSQYLISLLYMLENMWADVGEVKMCLMRTI